ncbi:MAG: sensor histidine kinase, partial [Blastocatellia bacterium]
VEVVLAQDLPEVHGDHVRLVQVLQNLLENAGQFRGEHKQPRVDIGMRADAAGRVFYVRDNGIGIASRHHENIFRIFKRLHGRDEWGGGTGVGLTIVRRIIERHGGRVWVESAPSAGTTFYFTLTRGSENDERAIPTSAGSAAD